MLAQDLRSAFNPMPQDVLADIQVPAGLHHRNATLFISRTASSLNSRLNYRRTICTLRSRETP